MEMFDELKKIEAEVSLWSKTNFGNQPFTYPLLGVNEELGEFFSADNIPDMIDAAADAMIFLMDFSSRFESETGYELSFADCVKNVYTDPFVHNDINSYGLFNSLTIYTGLINRSVLKIRQGIRTNEKHFDNLKYAIGGLWLAYDNIMKYISAEHSGPVDIYSAVSQTWNNIVSKRDWTNETKA